VSKLGELELAFCEVPACSDVVFEVVASLPVKNSEKGDFPDSLFTGHYSRLIASDWGEQKT